jgi:hypothetical protein
LDVPASPQELVRPWRTATIVASSIAAVELLLLLGAGAVLLARPLSHAVRRHAEVAAQPAKEKAKQPTARRHKKAARPAAAKLSRAHTRVVVYNGNGRAGAAAHAAAKLQTLGYAISGTGNASRQDYAATVVLYSAGFRPEAERLARDVGAKVVGPVDGMPRSALMGGQLAIILGA